MGHRNLVQDLSRLVFLVLMEIINFFVITFNFLAAN